MDRSRGWSGSARSDDVPRPCVGLSNDTLARSIDVEPACAWGEESWIVQLNSQSRFFVGSIISSHLGEPLAWWTVTSSPGRSYAQYISSICSNRGLGSQFRNRAGSQDSIRATRSRQSTLQPPWSPTLSLSHQRDSGPFSQHLCVSSDAQSSTKSSLSTGPSHALVFSDSKRVG